MIKAMKIRGKGQTWSTDAIIAVSLFIGVLIVFFYIAGFLSQGQKFDELKGIRLVAWIGEELKARGASMTAEAARYLAQNVGGDMIRFSGMEVWLDPSKPFGKRVIKLLIGGKPVDPEKIKRDKI